MNFPDERRIRRVTAASRGERGSLRRRWNVDRTRLQAVTGSNSRRAQSFSSYTARAKSCAPVKGNPVAGRASSLLSRDRCIVVRASSRRGFRFASRCTVPPLVENRETVRRQRLGPLNGIDIASTDPVQRRPCRIAGTGFSSSPREKRKP